MFKILSNFPVTQLVPFQSSCLQTSYRIQEYLRLDLLSYIFLCAQTSRVVYMDNLYGSGGEEGPGCGLEKSSSFLNPYKYRPGQPKVWI